MIFQIDGHSIPMQRVYFREFGYGKETPGYQVLLYIMTVSLDEFCEAFQSFFNNYAEDDATYGADADEIDLELRMCGWPPLSELARQYPKLL